MWRAPAARCELGVRARQLSVSIFGCRARGLYPLARGCRIRPALGMAPALLVCWIAGGAGFFLFSVVASSHRVDRGRHLASSTFAGVLNVELSLPIFRLPRSRSLSLGEGLPDSTGARDGTRAAGVLDRGRRRLFSF